MTEKDLVTPEVARYRDALVKEQELSDELAAARQEIERLRGALRRAHKVLSQCDYATQRVPLGVTAAVSYCLAALEPGND